MRKSLLNRLILASIFSLLPQEGFAGQIHPRYISLEDLVRRSDLIVIARPESPFITEKMIPLAKGRKRAPPFRLVTCHFQVIETLIHGWGPVPARIAVSAADWESDMEVAKQYYLKGISKHVVREYYESKTAPQDPGKQPVILFLYYRSESAEFVAQGGYESVEMKRTVVRLISKK